MLFISFSFKGQNGSFGSYVLLICLLLLIGIIVFYIIKGNSLLNQIFSRLNIDNKDNNKIENPPKQEAHDNNIRKSSKENALNNNHGVDKVNKDIILTEYEINNL